MLLIPAIDLKNGKVVRLVQGHFDQVTEYNTHPAKVAQHWEKDGAKLLHVVDLDGAATGHLKNLDAIRSIVEAVKIPVQLGGGIRSKDIIDLLLGKKGSVSRVVLGTSAVIEKDIYLRPAENQGLKDIIAKWTDRIAVSIDCSDGYVTYRGWTKKANIKGTELAKDLEEIGVQCLIYTDIARDGMLKGPNFDGIEEILKTVRIPVIASGGIARSDDVEKLKRLSLDYPHLLGAITGKAIYEGTLDFKDALKILAPHNQ
ncbi:MAG: 1-(5-phosphoribosyl)-5-[(5-phosphoribosylamino)methylideneamino]imidazole-4-carboxamide isomerase [Candidatus Omnitrophota bacterium]|nr:1-(5-phosphoribosyl)-5-[(5-phosphoribosylamino)methylideneamino]imidazole-4-carboxamide isomerase [Candidatus Omnitrophota bacterium]MDZ4243292.1 1-(5-phosphoribosyl)-5-[(5-phosphoribosylamino)methylideneamino]imidazole-4-carboxamide isomerase [Candidatus Omnitrophota bacterium]